MNDVNVAIETTEAVKPVGADIVELTVEQLGEVGGGVAYVFL